jgi:CRP/FNR family transcriptional regulator, anaerobic regulatory protein
MHFQQKELSDEIEQIAIVKKFMAGDEILRENSYVNVIPILRKGLLGVYRTDEEGREILLYYIKPDETCIMSFLAGINHDTSKVKAIAEEDSDLILIPIDKVSHWIQKYPEWTDYIFKLYHKRFEELLDVVNSIAFQKMDERILSLLQKKTALSNKSALNITHQQLADELGSSREVISRLLKQLERTGRVTLSRNKIILV